MNKIIPIFQIDSKEDTIEISKIDKDQINDFGNGFFISENGYFATVAHVFKDIELNYYGSYKDKLYRIEILKRIKTDEYDENHLDIAIGHINIKGCDYYDQEIFKKVEDNLKLKIVGYSRLINIEFYKSNYFFKKTGCKYCEIITSCIDSTEYYSIKKRLKMKNFFTLLLDTNKYKGLSGSIIIDENNNIVGLFNGGAVTYYGDNISKNMFGQAIHIELIKEVYNRI